MTMMYRSVMLRWTRKAVLQLYISTEWSTPDGVRDWTRIGETEYYDYTSGDVLTGFTSLVVNDREFSGKYIEEHMAEVQMLLDSIYTEEKLQELTSE